MCFFDYTAFENCTMTGLKYTNCVFAGSGIRNVTIKEATLFQNNFNNCILRDVSITETDLYNSRFIASQIDNTIFYDCNLKNVDFRNSLRYKVKFKYSNFEDAFFDGEDDA